MNLVDGPDAALRSAAFAWLSRVTDGGELPVSWQELQSGFVHNDEIVILIGPKGIWKTETGPAAALNLDHPAQGVWHRAVRR